MKAKYDGYHFSKESPDIYNPFSLIRVLGSKEYENYWFATGTPTFLIKLMQKYDVKIEDIESTAAKAEDFDAPTDTITNYVPVFYQSGYLTIKDYDKDFDSYTLSFPNQEVRVGFTKCLVPYYAPSLSDTSSFFIDRFVIDLREGRIADFMLRTQAFFSSISYDVENKTEKHFQSIFDIFSVLLGQYSEVEKRIAAGRIDMIIGTKDYLYIFEFKINKVVIDALTQIDEKHYDLPYSVDGRKLYKIGVNFDAEKRTIEDYQIK